MGDLIQFPVGGRKSVAPRAPLELFCAACGQGRTDDGPCSCGGRVFTSDSGLAVGASCNVQVIGIRSPVPVEVVTPGGSFQHDPPSW